MSYRPDVIDPYRRAAGYICDIAEIGDGLPLSMEERSCSGHHCNEQQPGRVLRMELRSGERQLRRRDELSYCR